MATTRAVRLLTSLCLAVTLSLSACQKAQPTPPSASDWFLGSRTAPVTLIEYASVACPHCAAFNNDVLPTLRARYIDTGKVRYILREALTGDTGLAAAGFLMARCSGKDHYFKVIDEIFHAQSQMFASGSPEHVLLDIAKGAGLSEAQFQACISDPAALADIDARWAHTVKSEKIRQTPTFVINGEVYEGEMTMSELTAAIAKAQSRPAS